MIFRVDFDALPEEERDDARFVEGNIYQLDKSVEDFRATLELYLHVLALADGDFAKLRHDWIRIIGRSGAIVAHGLAMALTALNSLKAPTIQSKVDRTERDKATKLFSKEFPRIEGVRNAAAHPGELSASSNELKKHGLKEAVQTPFIVANENSGNFLSDICSIRSDALEYSATFKGKLVSYELSAGKAGVLERVIQHYRDAYRALEPPGSAEFREWLAEIGVEQQSDRNGHQ